MAREYCTPLWISSSSRSRRNSSLMAGIAADSAIRTRAAIIIRLTKPKNFKGRGGGGGGGGGGSGSVFVTTGDTTGLGMSTSAWKIFRPAPVYLVSSLARNSPSCKVGSSETGATLAFLVPVALLAEV